MKLWSDELEAMRPRLREEADAFIASFTSELDDPSLPVPERIARQRAVADERVTRSEMAVDRKNGVFYSANWGEGLWALKL